jgi:glycosyltransferase involved in cell wall biosynthesis
MNIMEIISGADVNGAVVHCLLLTRELAQRGHRVTLVCRPGAWIATQLRGAPVDIVESDLHRWPPDEVRRLAAIARAQAIDVLHTHMSRAHFFGVLLRWLSGVPSVATAHSRHIQLHWMCNDRVIAVSEATGRFHRTRNLVRRTRLDVVHNFVDYRRFEADESMRIAMRAAFKVPAASLLIGSIGDVIPDKGLIHLLRALPTILCALPAARLLVVGGGPTAYRAALEREAERLGVSAMIIWAGQRTDVADIMKALDVFVLPSLEENFPLVVAEAMAAALPVVATAVGGVPECVSPGETGVLVPPADAAALADALMGLLCDAPLRCRLGETARQRVRQRFSPEVQVPRIEAALLLAAQRRPVALHD